MDDKYERVEKFYHDNVGPFMTSARLWDAVYIGLLTSEAVHGEVYESWCQIAAKCASTAVKVRQAYLEAEKCKSLT